MLFPVNEPAIKSPYQKDTVIIPLSPMEWKNADWTHFYQEYAGYLFRIIYRWVHSEDKANDILQQTFALAFKKRDQLPYPDGTKTWLYRSARFFMLDLYKKDKREQERGFTTDGIDDLAQQTTSVETELKLKDLMQQAISTLSDNLREAVILTRLEGYSTEEAANMTGTKPATMRKRVARGLAELKEAFHKLDQDSEHQNKRGELHD